MTKKAFFSSRRGRIIVISIITAALILTAIPLYQSIANHKESIKVGVIIPLTGTASYLTEMRDALILAKDDINKYGGINGREVELLIRDSESNANVGITLFQELESSYHPLFYISALSSVSVAISHLAEESKVVLIGLATSTQNFTTGKQWTYRYYYDSKAEVTPTMKVLEDLRVSSLGIIYLNDSYGKPIYGLIHDDFEGIGGNIKAISYPSNETDFSQEISYVSGCEAIYVVGLRTHFPYFFTNLNASGYQGHVLVSSPASSPSITSMPEAEGAYVSAPLFYNPNYLLAASASKEYEGRYNTQASHQAATGIDILRMIAGLLEDHEISRDSLKNILDRSRAYSGTLGDIVTTEGSHEMNFTLYPAIMERGGSLKYL